MYVLPVVVVTSNIHDIHFHSSFMRTQYSPNSRSYTRTTRYYAVHTQQSLDNQHE
jgi:hypothetical protein